MKSLFLFILMAVVTNCIRIDHDSEVLNDQKKIYESAEIVHYSKYFASDVHFL